jgi:hypothetical protein
MAVALATVAILQPKPDKGPLRCAKANQAITQATMAADERKVLTLTK